MPLEKRLIKNRRKKGNRFSKGRFATKADVKKMIDKTNDDIIETKYIDLVIDSPQVSYTTSNTFWYQLGNVSLGTNSNQRIGTDVLYTSIFARLVFTIADATNLFRMVIVQDRNSKNIGNNYPTWAELLEYNTLSGYGITPTICSPLSLTENRGRFKVLVDRMILLSPDSPQECVEIYKKLNVKKIFEITAGANSEGKNSLYIAFISDSSISSHPVVSGFVRTGYKDA